MLKELQTLLQDIGINSQFTTIEIQSSFSQRILMAKQMLAIPLGGILYFVDYSPDGKFTIYRSPHNVPIVRTVGNKRGLGLLQVLDFVESRREKQCT